MRNYLKKQKSTLIHSSKYMMSLARIFATSHAIKMLPTKKYNNVKATLYQIAIILIQFVTAKACN